MAVTNPTLKTSGGSATDSASQTTASITVAEGDEVFVLQGNVDGNPITIETPTDTFGDTGGSAWSAVENVSVGNTAAALWHRRIGSSPASGTITLNASAAVLRWSWIVVTVTGQDTTTPIAESDPASSAAATSLSPAITGVASGNLVLAGFIARNQTAITSDADFTEVVEATSGGTNEARISLQFDPNDDEIANTSSWTGSVECVGIIAEVAAAAAAAVSFREPRRLSMARGPTPVMIGHKRPAGS